MCKKLKQNYLIKKGLPKYRIVSTIGVGNEKPIEKCEECTEEQLDNSLDGFKTKMGISAIIGKVDLMTYCNNSFEKIKQTESRKFGRRKDRIKIDCYTVDK